MCPASVCLVKLGGSAITDKSKYLTPRPEVMASLAKDLSKYINNTGNRIMVVHGAGSFGHILAKEGRLKDGISHPERQLTYVAQVQRDVRALDLMVVDALLKAGVRAVSVPPALITEKSPNGINMDMSYFQRLMDQGFVPVTFGDVVPDSRLGWSILSGDDIMLMAAARFGAARAIFVSDVDGIFRRYPPESEDDLMAIVTKEGMEGVSMVENLVDVTGSMRRKAELCLRIVQEGGGEVCIINGLKAGRLYDALTTHTRGTYFRL